MNIYWCFEKSDYFGLYVIAETRGQAKRIYADEVTECFIDIRCQICIKNVNEKAGIIDAENTKLLEKYHLEYEEATPDNWDYGCVL